VGGHAQYPSTQTEHPAKGLERKRGRYGGPFFVVAEGLVCLSPPVFWERPGNLFHAKAQRKTR
jgi:hypothetical protein